MTRLSIRLVGEDSSRTLETAGDSESVTEIAKRIYETGYLLGKMKASERMPEAQEVAILATQVKWIALAGTTR